MASQTYRRDRLDRLSRLWHAADLLKEQQWCLYNNMQRVGAIGCESTCLDLIWIARIWIHQHSTTAIPPRPRPRPRPSPRPARPPLCCALLRRAVGGAGAGSGTTIVSLFAYSSYYSNEYVRKAK